MEKELLEALKNKTREERTEYFNAHKAELLDESLASVNGGAGGYTNPNSDVPDAKGNYYTSWGFICRGSSFCG